MQEKYTNAFLAAGPEDKNFALELTYNYGKDSYNIGSGFGHFALRVEDVYKTVDSIKAAGMLGRPCLHITTLDPSCMQTGSSPFIRYICKLRGMGGGMSHSEAHGVGVHRQVERCRGMRAL